MQESLPWLDEEAGPLVRPYALIAGRTEVPRQELDLITTVVASPGMSTSDGELGSECERILALCRKPLSVAEISSRLRLPVGIVRVLLSDLLHRGLLHRLDQAEGADAPNPASLRAVINGLRSL